MTPDETTAPNGAISVTEVTEASRRGKRAIEVGTANASIGKLAFYQRCGFRFDHVRRDPFRYHRTPLYENGIEIRDLVVFRRDLTTR